MPSSGASCLKTKFTWYSWDSSVAFSWLIRLGVMPRSLRKKGGCSVLSTANAQAALHRACMDNRQDVKCSETKAGNDVAQVMKACNDVTSLIKGWNMPCLKKSACLVDCAEAAKATGQGFGVLTQVALTFCWLMYPCAVLMCPKPVTLRMHRRHGGNLHPPPPPSYPASQQGRGPTHTCSWQTPLYAAAHIPQGLTRPESKKLQ